MKEKELEIMAKLKEVTGSLNEKISKMSNKKKSLSERDPTTYDLINKLCVAWITEREEKRVKLKKIENLYFLPKYSLWMPDDKRIRHDKIHGRHIPGLDMRDHMDFIDDEWVWKSESSKVFMSTYLLPLEEIHKVCLQSTWEEWQINIIKEKDLKLYEEKREKEIKEFDELLGL